jgi:hypothetical protein
MAAAPPQAIRTTPDAFDGNPAKAKSFWNALENYYTLNDVVYTNEGQKVAASLTHFKMGTLARDWASNHLATALGATPITYGTVTWDYVLGSEMGRHADHECLRRSEPKHCEHHNFSSPHHDAFFFSFFQLRFLLYSAFFSLSSSSLRLRRHHSHPCPH